MDGKEARRMSDGRKTKKSGLIPGTAVLFASAIGLLSFSAIGSTRAALTYYSETYSAPPTSRASASLWWRTEMW